jgi:hypothetical protein
VKRYFVAANLWLLIALCLYVGGKDRLGTVPAQVRVFDYTDFHWAAYYLLVGLCVAVAVGLFVTHEKQRRNWGGASHRG